MHAIGIDLGGTKINFGLIGLKKDSFKILKKIQIPSPSEQKKLIRALQNNIKRLQSKRVERIGIALAGQIDLKKKKSLCSPNIKILERISFVKILGDQFGLPILLDNDANAFVLAESTYGAGQGKKKVAGLTLGTGIGGGIVLGTKIYHGAFTTAAEFGHMIIEQNGRPCFCGQKGCLEAYASATAIIREYQRRSGFSKDSYSIQEEAEANLEPAKAVFSEAAQALAVGLINIINMIEPEMIVLGGGLARIKILVDQSMKLTKKIIKPKLGDRPQILRAKLGTESGMIGAALLH